MRLVSRVARDITGDESADSQPRWESFPPSAHP